MWWPLPSEVDMTVHLNWEVHCPPFDVGDIDREAWSKALRPAQRALYHDWAREGFTRKEMEEKKCFCKAENYIKPRHAIKPRMIHGTHAISNFLAGPTISAHSKRLEKHVNQSQDWYLPYTASPDRMTQDVEDRLDFEPIYYIEMDGTRMDAAINPTFNDCLQRFIPHEEGSDAIMKYNKKLVGRTRHGVKFTSYHGLATGVQHTAFNHSLYMWMSWRTWRDRSGLEGQVLCLNKGDDLLILVGTINMPVENLARGFAAFLEEGGLTCTQDIRKSMFSSEFLSMRPYRTRDGRLQWVPKLGRLLPKLCWAASVHRVKSPATHAYLISQGFKNLWNVPIAGAFMAALARCSEEDSRDLIDLDSSWAYKMVGTGGHDRQALLFEFQELYGCTVGEIEDLEAELDRVDTLPFVLENRLMEKFTFVDLGTDAMEPIDPGPVSYRGPPLS
jgi:hypothetical protein